MHAVPHIQRSERINWGLVLTIHFVTVSLVFQCIYQASWPVNYYSSLSLSPILLFENAGIVDHTTIADFTWVLGSGT